MKNLPLVLFLFAHLAADAQTKKVDYTIAYNFTYITDTVQNTYSDLEEYILFKYKYESRFINSYAYHNDSLRIVVYKKLGNKAGTQEGVNIYLKEMGKEKKKHVSDLRVQKNSCSEINQYN